MKATAYIVAYVALAIPTFFAALFRLVDIADPPVVTPETGHSFWLTSVGQCLWFGTAFLLPALVIFAFRFGARRLWRLSERNSHVLA